MQTSTHQASPAYSGLPLRDDLLHARALYLRRRLLLLSHLLLSHLSTLLELSRVRLLVRGGHAAIALLCRRLLRTECA